MLTLLPLLLLQGVTWLLCLGGVALTTASLLSSVVFYDPDMQYNGVAAGLYAALCPVIWSVGVCLVLASLVLGSKSKMFKTPCHYSRCTIRQYFLV